LDEIPPLQVVTHGEILATHFAPSKKPQEQERATARDAKMVSRANFFIVSADCAFDIWEVLID